MGKNSITTKEMAGSRVVGGKRGNRRIGKVRRFVFHPSEKRVIGFIVKRPDLLWMFRRKDKFVSIDGYDLVDGRVLIREDATAVDRAAYKALGVNPDEAIMWLGLPIMTEDKATFGVVGNVTFNSVTGTVESIEADEGATANTLLGKREIPADLIKGFRKGIGVKLSVSGQEGEENEDPVIGALLVAEEVQDLNVDGGVAEKAGQATAVVADKASKATAAVSEQASKVAKKTGEVVNKGAYATGKQLGKTKGMFSAFKEEYDKARNEGEE